MLGSQKCVYILRVSLLSNQSLWVGKCSGWEFVHFLSDEKFSTFPKRRRRQQWRLSCTCFLRLPLVWKGAKYSFNIYLLSNQYFFCFFRHRLVWKGAKRWCLQDIRDVITKKNAVLIDFVQITPLPPPSWSPNSTVLHLDIYLLSWWWGALWAWGTFFKWL